MFIIIVCFILILLLIVFFNGRGVPCIMYHNVSKDKGINSEDFGKQLDILKNFNTFKFEEFSKINNKLPKNSALVTFDDGYKDNYTNAFPLLKKYGIKATIFLNTAYIENDPFYMTWDQVKEMYDSGLVDFQLHTHSHFTVIKRLEIQGFFKTEDMENRELYREMKNIFGSDNLREGYPIFKKRGETAIRGYKVTNNFMSEYNKLLDKYKDLEVNAKEKKLKEEIETNLSQEIKEYTYEEYKKRVENEILLNKKMIEDHLNKKCDYFANPWGHRSKELIDILHELGIKGMITTKKGTNYLKPNIYKIRRYETKTMKQFKKLLFINKNYLMGKIYEIVS